jgi:hypothetical protein
MSQDTRTALRRSIDRELNSDWAQPFSELIAEARTDIEEMNSALLQLPKIFGRRHLVSAFSSRPKATITGDFGDVPIGHWRIDEALKVLLLAESVGDEDGASQRLFEIYDQGDSEARVACLRALNFTLDAPHGGLTLVYDAGRTYLTELMGAAWCHNPFSSTHLTDEEYRKAVLKSLFCDLPVDGFLGLEERADSELARSLCEYANEREAAGRPVPYAVWAISARFPQPGLVARFIGKLEHPLEEERAVAARALGEARDRRGESFLKDRLRREESPTVIEEIECALSTLSALERD